MSYLMRWVAVKTGPLKILHKLASAYVNKHKCFLCIDLVPIPKASDYVDITFQIQSKFPQPVLGIPDEDTLPVILYLRL